MSLCRHTAGLNQQVKVVGHQRPSQTARRGLPSEPEEPVQKTIPAKFILEDTLTLYPPADDVMQRTACDDAGASGHGALTITGHNPY